MLLETVERMVEILQQVCVFLKTYSMGKCFQIKITFVTPLHLFVASRDAVLYFTGTDQHFLVNQGHLLLFISQNSRVVTSCTKSIEMQGEPHF